MTGLALVSALAILLVVVLGVVVVLVARRRSTPKFETYRPGVYNSLEKRYEGPGPQHQNSGPVPPMGGLG